MKCACKVKLNFDYINDFLKKRGITKGEFCRRIGYANNWLAGVESGKKCYSNGINEAKARLMCTVWGMKYDSLVIKEREPVLAVEVDEKKSDIEKALLMLTNCMAVMTENQKTIADYLRNMGAKVDELHKQLK